VRSKAIKNNQTTAEAGTAHDLKRSKNNQNNSRSRNSTGQNRQLQCSVDTSFFHGQNQTCFGYCICGAEGQSVRALIGWYPQNMLVYEGETLAMLNVMNWVQELGLQSVTFLSDSQVLIDAVCSSRMCIRVQCHC